jgi:signal transduction histidine kinase
VRTDAEQRDQKRSYRGPDRRQGASPGGVTADRGWVVAGITLGAIVLGLLLVALWRQSGPPPVSVTPALRMASVVLAVVLVVVARLHWRATGLAIGARLQTGAWLLAGAASISLAAVEVELGPSLLWLRLAFAAGAATWIAWGVAGPDVEVPIRPGRELLVALAAVMISWVVFMSLAPEALTARAELAAGVAGLMLGVVWLTLAALAIVRAVMGSSVLIGWVAWLALAWAVAELARFAGGFHSGNWVALSAGARGWGLLILTTGLAAHLARNVVDQRGEMHVAELHRREEDRERHERERDRVHEIRNALFAIEGATLTLERFRDDLAPEDRDELAAAVSTGIGRLREILQPKADRHEPFAPWPLAAEHAALLRARGISVTVEGDDDAQATGDPGACGQVFENLLSNAVRHGDAARNGVVIEVFRAADRVLVRVSDRGPGIPEGEEERVFERGVRLRPEFEGDGVGLPVARGLARRQGGDLWAEPSAPGYGACFSLALPAADVAASDDRLLEEAEQLREVVESHLAAAVGEQHDAPTSAGGVVVQPDHGLGIDVFRIPRHDRNVEAGAHRSVEHDGDIGLRGQQGAQALGEQERRRREGDAQSGRGSGCHNPREH